MGAQYDRSFLACGRIWSHGGVRADLAGAAIVVRVGMAFWSSVACVIEISPGASFAHRREWFSGRFREIAVVAAATRLHPWRRRSHCARVDDAAPTALQRSQSSDCRRLAISFHWAF